MINFCVTAEMKRAQIENVSHSFDTSNLGPHDGQWNAASRCSATGVTAVTALSLSNAKVYSTGYFYLCNVFI